MSTAAAMKLSLNEEIEIEIDTEALWFAEAERRLEELRCGKVQGIDSEEAFRTAREVLQQ
jgi:hypothetical protein